MAGRFLSVLRNCRPLLSKSSLYYCSVSKFPVIEKDSADIFGTLDPLQKVAQNFRRDELDDQDGEEEFEAKISDVFRPKPFDYVLKINRLLDKKSGGIFDLAAALKVLDDEMAKECVKPTPEIFRLVIHGCGKVGYVDKAFQLHRQYVQRKMEHNWGIITDLFNACANCPIESRTRALKHATSLRDRLMQRYSAVWPKPVYNSMIKAFGRCGDLEMSLCILDEMRGVDAYTINHVLQACISDRQAGFRHALIVWRKMMKKKIKPSVQSYNLLVRAVKECGAGDESFTADLLIEAMSPQDVRQYRKRLDRSAKLLTLQSSQDSVQWWEMKSTEQPVESRQVPRDSSNAKVPSLVENTVSVEHLVGVGDLSCASQRFRLFGSLERFIAQAVEVDKVQLDIKTFSLLLHCIDNTVEAEEELLGHIKRLQVQTDVDFYNQLIRRRASRQDFQTGRDVIRLIGEDGHSPSVQTFGCLAMCCHSTKMIKQFLATMTRQNVRPNMIILTTLMKNASFRKNPHDMVVLLQKLDQHSLTPDVKLLKVVDQFFQTYRAEVLAIERGSDAAASSASSAAVTEEVNNGLPNWKEFCAYYKEWLAETKVEQPQHPWRQYVTDKDISQFVKGNNAGYRDVIRDRGEPKSKHHKQ